MAGVGTKEQRQYEHIKESAEKSGRYGNRAKEVAARTVMKEHKKKGTREGQVTPAPEPSAAQRGAGLNFPRDLPRAS